jgi:hypothetical protein
MYRNPGCNVRSEAPIIVWESDIHGKEKEPANGIVEYDDDEVGMRTFPLLHHCSLRSHEHTTTSPPQYLTREHRLDVRISGGQSLNSDRLGCPTHTFHNLSPPWRRRAAADLRCAYACMHAHADLICLCAARLVVADTGRRKAAYPTPSVEDSFSERDGDRSKYLTRTSRFSDGSTQWPPSFVTGARSRRRNGL